MKQRFQEIVKEMVEIHERKNKDYAGCNYLSNFRMSETMGIPAWKGIIVRMTDKMSRLMNLAKSENPAVASESVNDTLTDLAIYSILARILIEEAQSDAAPKDTRAANRDRPRIRRQRKKVVAQPQEPPLEESSVQTS